VACGHPMHGRKNIRKAAVQTARQLRPDHTEDNGGEAPQGLRGQSIRICGKDDRVVMVAGGSADDGEGMDRYERLYRGGSTVLSVPLKRDTKDWARRMAITVRGRPGVPQRPKKTGHCGMRIREPPGRIGHFLSVPKKRDTTEHACLPAITRGTPPDPAPHPDRPDRYVSGSRLPLSLLIRTRSPFSSRMGSHPRQT